MGQQMAALLHGNRRDGPVGQDARGITAHMLRSVDCLSALLASHRRESSLGGLPICFGKEPGSSLRLIDASLH